MGLQLHPINSSCFMGLLPIFMVSILEASQFNYIDFALQEDNIGWDHQCSIYSICPEVIASDYEQGTIVYVDL